MAQTEKSAGSNFAVKSIDDPAETLLRTIVMGDKQRASVLITDLSKGYERFISGLIVGAFCNSNSIPIEQRGPCRDFLNLELAAIEKRKWTRNFSVGNATFQHSNEQNIGTYHFNRLLSFILDRNCNLVMQVSAVLNDSRANQRTFEFMVECHRLNES